MRISAVAFLMILTTMFLSGCTQERKMASVEDRGTYYYGRSHIAQQQTATVMAAPVAPVANVAPFAPAMKAPTPATAAAIPAQPVFEKAPVQQVNTGTAPNDTPTPAITTTEEGTMAMGGTAWQWPVQGKVIEQFGSQRNGANSEGITIAAAEGAPILAAQSGEVAYVGHNVRDYGNMVILRHADGTLSSYSHARDISVKRGDKVEIGSIIGTVGNSGSAATPQLHFALRQDGHAVDPLARLPQNVASNLI